MVSKKFGPRSKEQRKLRSRNVAKSSDNISSNASEIIPEAAADARALRRQQLQDGLRLTQGQMSSKKKKRLDKYIENKLKKEESVELLKKLALQKSNVSGLQSSRSFDRRPGNAHPNMIERDTKTYAESSSDDSPEESTPRPSGEGQLNADKTILTSQSTGLVLPTSTGSGLKRPLARDASGVPVIRKRQRVSMPSRFISNHSSKSAKPHKPLSEDSGTGSESESGSYSDSDPEDEISSDVSEESWDGISDDGGNTTRSTTGFTQKAKSSVPKGSSVKDKTHISQSGNDDTVGSDDPERVHQDRSDDEETDDDYDTAEDDQAAEDLAASMFAAIAQARRGNVGDEASSQQRDVSGFKEWATEQINEAQNFIPSRALDDAIMAEETNIDKRNINFTPQPIEQEELPPEAQVPSTSSDRKAHTVLVERDEEIQQARSRLPVVAEEQKIMEAIHNNPVTIVCGATGSGKTTQIPQFLFEAGYGDPQGPTPGMIAVTQPRRVAAVTMARRVSQELGDHGDKVAYQIRYGSTAHKGTVIKFMTDGILIREIASDFTLAKYSAIVIDEAHERGVNTDILIGMLSRIVRLRAEDHARDPSKHKPLKLIIMSATLMAESFIGNPILFKDRPPPLVQSEGRQYPVSMHFARQTKRDYLDEACRKITLGHKKLPPGAMLVFLTGESEIIALSKRLREAFGQGQHRQAQNVRIAAVDAPLENDDFDMVRSRRDDPEEESGDDTATESDGDEFDIEADETEPKTTGTLVLPLYSKLPTKEQLRVFEPPPENTRLIVLATNVAETSITIPGVRYVFDCGRSKEKVYDQITGVMHFEIGWISKASATQRAGRAGRTGPGHCYRLYSSAVYERDFAEHTDPEILQMPAEGVVLQLKSMDLVKVQNFPFPTPPDMLQITKAERLLENLGALDGVSRRITDIGRDLSIYPISPRYAKMLAIGHQHGCMQLTIAVVAALATPELFLPHNHLDLAEQNSAKDVYDNAQMLEEEAREMRRKEYNRAHNLFGALDRYSDAIKLMAAFAAYLSAAQNDPDGFCRRMFMRGKALKEAHQLFQQLSRIVADNYPGLIDAGAQSVPKPSATQVAALKKIVAVGFIDQVAIRADLLASPPSLPRPKRATEVAYVTLFPSHEDGTPEDEQCVYVHATSVLAQRSVNEMPAYVTYATLQRGTGKVRMHPLTNVSEGDLMALAKGTPLLEYSKPLGKVEYLPGEPDKRTCWVTPMLVGRRGRVGWPLRERKVLQKRVKGDWKVEKFAD